MAAYLTVPDVLWINLQLTGANQKYRYDRLEEATFAQYGHGSSLDPVGQAARLLASFPSMRPFDKGNDATAFVAFATFLALNGRRLEVPDAEAATWARSVWSDPARAREAVEAGTVETEVEAEHGIPDTHAAAQAALDRYPESLKALIQGEAAVPIGR